jgi:hypothetical protein
MAAGSDPLMTAWLQGPVVPNPEYSPAQYASLLLSTGCSDVKELIGMARVLSRRLSRPSFAAACLSDERAQGRPGTG